MKYKLVPLEPTPEMLCAGHAMTLPASIWYAMLAAAPAAPVELEPVKLKPAGYTLISDGVRVGLYAFKQDAMEKGMEIGARFDLLPLYHALPPDAAAVIAANDADTDGSAYRLEVMEREHADFFYRWHGELRIREKLVDDVERCYRMLLSEPNTKGALFKAENILREALAEANAKTHNAKLTGSGTESG